MSYTPKSSRKSPNNPGRRPDPSKWLTGPDPVRRNKYYAWLKHRAQENYLKREYFLTWEDFEAVWPDDKWHLRGRSASSLCLARIDHTLGWANDNIHVVTRDAQLKQKRKRKQPQ